MHSRNVSRIIGTGMTALRSGKAAQQHPADAVTLMVEALHLAVQDAGISLSDLDTLIALPSLMSDQHFMIGHAVAQQASLTPRSGMLVRTLDVGGAGPVAALLAAARAIQHEGRKAVAIVVGDTVASTPVEQFLARADSSCRPKWSSSQQHTTTATAGSLTADSVNGNDRCSSSSNSSGGGNSDVKSSRGASRTSHRDELCRSADAGEFGSASPDSSSITTGTSSSSSSRIGSWTVSSGPVPSPVIPNLYDMVARWHMRQYGTTREQLAMCASLMTYQASHHPAALHRRPRLLQEVLASAPIGPVTTKLECAKLADGAAAIVLVPGDSQHSSSRAVAVRGGGEGSGPLYPPSVITEDCFSAGYAAAAAYHEAGLTPADIHYWGLYDCFPICLIRAIEAVGLAPQGMAGSYVQQQYESLLGPLEQQQRQQYRQHVWPVNTHGGLLGFGAPWEVPAMHGLIEAVAQLRGEAAGRQVAGATAALVYGNGGIFSASAVAILESCRATAPVSRL